MPIIISNTCPLGDCRVTTTFEFSDELKENPGYIAEVKKKSAAKVAAAHKAGEHKVLERLADNGKKQA